MNSTKYGVAVGVVVVLFVAGALIALNTMKSARIEGEKQNAPKTQAVQVSQTEPQRVFDKLELFNFKDPVHKADVGREYTLPVVLDSHENLVTGYDVVVQYDPKVLKFEKATSENSSYDVYERATSGKVVVTGIVKLASNVKPQVFQGLPTTNLLSLHFTPLRQGSTNITLVDVLDTKERSKIVTDKSHVYVEKQATVYPLTIQ